MDLQRELDALFPGAEEESSAAGNPTIGMPVFAEMAKTAVKAFDSGPTGPILQAPVDDGRALRYFALHVPFVVGMGEENDLIELANDRGRRGGLENFALQTGSLVSLPFPDGTFAGVYCQGHLGHLRKPRRALKEMLRVCAPGGHVIADFLAPQDATRRCDDMIPMDGGYVRGEQRTYYRYLDRWGVEEILGEAGALKLRTTIVERSWRSDANMKPHSVLDLRHSWVVVIRRDRL